MPRVRIKQLEERIATSGVHFGLGPAARKLEPGEVVEMPEGELFETLWATEKLDLTRDPVTRPIAYANEREAALCSPRFRPRGPDEQVEVDRARDKVSQRLAEDESTAPRVTPGPPVKEAPRKRRGRPPRRAAADNEQTAA